MRRSRPLAPPPAESRGAAAATLVAGALAGLLALGAADLAQPSGRASTDSLWSRLLFRNFDASAEGPGRRADEGSEIRLTGLWPSAPMAVELGISAKSDRGLRILVRGRPVLEASVGPRPSPAVFTTASDEAGTLSIGFAGPRREGVLLRVAGVRIRQQPPRRLTPPRALMYALVGPLALLLARRAVGSRRAPLVGLASLCVAAGAVALARLQALAGLPWLLGAMATIWAWLLGADAVRAVMRIPASTARWIVAALLLRVGLALAPGFGSVDAQWHTHQLWAHSAGQLMLSDAPGVALSPYPPALYALLSPLVTKDFARDERLIRLAMALLEGTAPFLVLALMRAAGAAQAAPAAAVTMAVMPEGLLVLAKGIAANILGSYATLLFLIAVLLRVHVLAMAALLALVFLSHAPVAFTVVLLLAAWWGRDAVEGAVRRRETVARLSALALAAAVAWAAYYREVPIALQAPGATATDPGLLGLRGYRAGKVAQDVVLKFGLGPVLLAGVGLRRWTSGGAPGLRRLLAAWFAVGVALGLVALLSRFPLRFEYFLTPAVAAAAGLGAERWQEEGRARAVTWAWGMALAIQAAIGALSLAGRFEIISVILESPRWPFPVRW